MLKSVFWGGKNREKRPKNMFERTKSGNKNSVRIMHGEAGNIKKCCPMWRHCSGTVKAEYAFLPEAKPRAVMLEVFNRGLQCRYRGQYFYQWPATTCIIHFSRYMISNTTYSPPTDLKYQNQWRSQDFVKGGGVRSSEGQWRIQGAAGLAAPPQ